MPCRALGFLVFYRGGLRWRMKYGVRKIEEIFYFEAWLKVPYMIQSMPKYLIRKGNTC
jgi:hypothetical protein